MTGDESGAVPSYSIPTLIDRRVVDVKEALQNHSRYLQYTRPTGRSCRGGDYVSA